MTAAATPAPARPKLAVVPKDGDAELTLRDLPTAEDRIELGLPGTVIYSGEIQAEENPALIREQAYGHPGGRTWGAWERYLRTDPDVSSAMEFLLGQIRDARVSVESASEELMPDRKLALAQADFLRWNLLTKLSPGWSALLQQMVMGLVPGFALHELVWDNVVHPTLPGGRGRGLVKLAERLPVSIHPNGWVQKDGELYEVEQLGPKSVGFGTDWPRVKIPAHKLQLFSWQRSGDNYAGFSAFRSVRYLCEIRGHLLRLTGISMVREAVGIPTAFTKDKTAKLTVAQRKKLIKLLSNLVYHENAAVVPPAGWEIGWIYSAAQNKNHVLEIWKAMGEVILRQLQAQQMVLGVNGTGSRAVGEVHDQGGDTFVLGVMAELENVINGVGDRPYTGIVRKIIDANWGPQSAYPSVRLATKKGKLPVKDKAEAMKVGKDAGFLTPTLADENVFREDVGLEPIDKEQREAERLAVPVEEPGGTTGTTPPAGETSGKAAITKQSQDIALNGAQIASALTIVQEVAAGRLPRDSGVEMLESFLGLPREIVEQVMGDVGRGFKPASEPKPEAFAARLKAAGVGLPFTPSRPLRASERVLDLQGMSDYLATARESFEKAVRPVVVEMLARAAPDIDKAMADGDPSDVHTVALDSARLDEVIRKFLDSARAEGKRQVAAELAKGNAEKVLEERAAGEPGVALKRITAATGDGGQDDGRDDEPSEQTQWEATVEADALVEAQASALKRRMLERTRRELETEAIDVLRTGGDAGEVVRNTLAWQMDTSAYRADAGTALTRIWNAGREEAAQLLGGVDEVEYSAILDSRVCDPCRSLDGKTFAFDSAEHDANTPPNRECEGGDLCRCVLVYLPSKGGNE